MISRTVDRTRLALGRSHWSVKLGFAILAVYLLLILVLMFWWSREPELFDAVEHGRSHAAEQQRTQVIGYTTTATLIRIAETLLDKPGGYLSNDVAPPGLFLDNMPNWEYGVVQQLRDMARAMRNDFSRSQTQSIEDPDLREADPLFHFQNDSWMLPATEREYRRAIKHLDGYLNRLAQPQQEDAQFYARADNLADWLNLVSGRLGSLSQRLSASVGQLRINTDLGGDSAARQATQTADERTVKTPWMELDDVFYEARGSAWALLHLLRAIEHDFEDILQKKNALVSLRQIIRELEATQQPMRSPIILNGGGFGLTANHSLVMANYLSRANAAIIDLATLLRQG